ncbi:hypothetical protein GCM10010517_18050 [Streptosporangium fragile]|uniref:Class F sortase n=1 Tax=Streptosporangium fragile TaxID=46186 RepID=A0ABP6I9J2_9ACTN
MVVAALVLLTLGVLWMGGWIDAGRAGERAGRDGLPRTAVHGGDTPGETAGVPAGEGNPGPVAHRITNAGGLPGAVPRPGSRPYPFVGTAF